MPTEAAVCQGALKIVFVMHTSDGAIVGRGCVFSAVLACATPAPKRWPSADFGQVLLELSSSEAFLTTSGELAYRDRPHLPTPLSTCFGSAVDHRDSVSCCCSRQIRLIGDIPRNTFTGGVKAR